MERHKRQSKSFYLIEKITLSSLKQKYKLIRKDAPAKLRKQLDRALDNGNASEAFTYFATLLGVLGEAPRKNEAMPQSSGVIRHAGKLSSDPKTYGKQIAGAALTAGVGGAIAAGRKYRKSGRAASKGLD